jgi:uncharacterized protein (TIGR04168 family)
VGRQEIKLAVIGDVHGHWDHQDEPALKALGIDLVLLVGDFGNEAVDLVRSIAQLSLPKAIAFGNHDAWYTATDWGRHNCPYDRTQEDRVQQQLDLLGESHVGYGKLDFPDFGLSVVGGRPFSWGGPEWKNAPFYRDRFGVNSFAESTDRMVTAARQTAFETLIFLGHNGPTGLGELPEDPCGKDWAPIGGDHGDPDLAAAIAHTQKLGKAVPLVTFGHMHHTLRHTKQYQRRALHVDETTGTVYLNAACAPRILHTENTVRRNFFVVTLQSGHVEQIQLVWLDPAFSITSEQLFYQRQPIGAASNPL